MTTFYRTVTYAITADSLERADEVWAEDGPELAGTRTITEVDDTYLLDHMPLIDPDAGED